MSSNIVRHFIKSAAAGPVIGPFSQAVQVNHTLYISGTLGLDPKTGQLIGDTVEEQTKQALINLGEILKEAGGDYKNVVKATVFLKDMNDFSVMNGIYGQFFTDKHPARSTIQVAGLPKDAKFEIEAIAIMGNIEDKEI